MCNFKPLYALIEGSDRRTISVVFRPDFESLLDVESLTLRVRDIGGRSFGGHGTPILRESGRKATYFMF